MCADRPCFRHCIYCDVDCYDSDVVHDRECPSSTGVWPAEGDECCGFCGDPVGDVYAAVPLGRTVPGDEKVVMIVCLPCKVLADTEKGAT